MDEKNTQVQNQEIQAQADATQQPITQAVDTAVVGQSDTRIQQIEELTKEEIQVRLQKIKDEETTLLEAAKKFEEEEKAKLVAWVKEHGLQTALLITILVVELLK